MRLDIMTGFGLVCVFVRTCLIIWIGSSAVSSQTFDGL